MTGDQKKAYSSLISKQADTEENIIYHTYIIRKHNCKPPATPAFILQKKMGLKQVNIEYVIQYRQQTMGSFFHNPDGEKLP